MSNQHPFSLSSLPIPYTDIILTALPFFFPPPIHPTTEPAKLQGLPESIEEYLEIRDKSLSITHASFNSVGTLLACGCKSGALLILDWATRGKSRFFSDLHTKPISSIIWTRKQQWIVTGSEDGKIIVFDILSEKVLSTLDVDSGPVVLLSSSSSNNNNNKGTNKTAPSFSSSSALILASFKNGQAIYLSLNLESGELVVLKDTKDDSKPLSPVAIHIVGEGRQARVVVGPKAAPYRADQRGQVALYSPCGNMVFAAIGGTLSVIAPPRASNGNGSDNDAAAVIYEIHRLPPLPGNKKHNILSMSIDNQGEKLLTVSNDKKIRVFGIPPASSIHSYPVFTAEEAETSLPSFTNNAGEKTVGKLKRAGSVLRRNNNAHKDSEQEQQQFLNLCRIFKSEIEQAPWSCATFSPDGGQHIVAALQADPTTATSGQVQEGEHIIYCWSVATGHHELTLEGGLSGNICQLLWHPAKYPMQLVANSGCSGSSGSSSGGLTVWAHNFTQNWSYFAPDFTEVKENDEYIEDEDEFDNKVVGRDGGEVDLNQQYVVGETERGWKRRKRKRREEEEEEERERRRDENGNGGDDDDDSEVDIMGVLDNREMIKEVYGVDKDDVAVWYLPPSIPGPAVVEEGSVEGMAGVASSLAPAGGEEEVIELE